MKILNQATMADIIAAGVSKIYPELKGQEIDIKFGYDDDEREFYTKIKLASEDIPNHDN